MPPDSEIIRIDRRAFVRRLLRAAALSIGAAAVGTAFWDRKGPSSMTGQAPSVSLPSFRLADQTGALAVVHGVQRRKTIAWAIEALGGMSAFVQPGDRVLLKVNAAFAAPPMLGATTHPDVVTQLTVMCLQAGAAEVIVTDNPINDPASCFALSGIGPAARAAGARVVLPTEDQFMPYSLPQGHLIRNWPVLAKPLQQSDKVIGLAPLKDHQRSGASMTLKNWYGLLGGRRNIFHQQVHTIITELALMVEPTLVILDGTVAMITNGPTGGSLDDLKETRTIIAGTDAVAVDAVGADVLGKKFSQLPYLQMAEKAGAGTADYKSLNPVEINA